MKALKVFLKRGLLFFKKLYWKLRLLRLKKGECFPGKFLKNTRDLYQQEFFGAPSDEDYQIWKQQVCAIASLKMVTDYLGKTGQQLLYQMAQNSRKFGTFEVPKKVEHPSDVKGIYHRGLEKYAQSLDLEALRDSLAPLEKVAWFLSQGWVFLASINYYQMYEERPEGVGRHIVVIVGVNLSKDKKGVYFKDPSWGRREETKVVSWKKFQKNFNKRGIFLKLKS